MAEFPYLPNSATLERFFNTIQSTGRPQKVTYKWLATVGFTSSNDRSIISILKALHFVDDSRVPTDRWMEYRNKEQSKGILASAIKEAYSTLFETYPDAYRKDDEALRNFFSSSTTVGEGTVSFMVRTFKALVLLADFEATSEIQEKISKELSQDKLQIQQLMPNGINLTINVQLQLPATDDNTIYEKLFEAMKKYLMS